MKKIALFLAAILIALAAVSVTMVVENKKRAALEAAYAAEAEARQAELQADKEALTALIKKVDYTDEPVYVIGHKSPDLDTVASAIGMAHLLRELGIRAEARIAGPLNLESEYALSAIGYSAPALLENAAGKQLWLVDHTDPRQMVDGAEEARIVGITDHHGIGGAETAEPINVLSCPAGSTSALVYALCAKCGAELPQDVAGVLLVGLLSDTSGMKSNGVTALDEAAFARLKELSGISDTDTLFDGMLSEKLSFKGMDDREIFYSDYKEYETNGFLYGIGVIKVAHPDDIPAMAERMLRVAKNETEAGSDKQLLIFQVYDPDYSLGYMGFCGGDGALAEKIMETAFGGIGEKRGEFYVFAPSLSRKAEMLPPLDTCLNTLLP